MAILVFPHFSEWLICQFYITYSSNYFSTLQGSSGGDGEKGAKGDPGPAGIPGPPGPIIGLTPGGGPPGPDPIGLIDEVISITLDTYHYMGFK